MSLNASVGPFERPRMQAGLERAQRRDLAASPNTSAV